MDNNLNNNYYITIDNVLLHTIFNNKYGYKPMHKQTQAYINTTNKQTQPYKSKFKRNQGF